MAQMVSNCILQFFTNSSQKTEEEGSLPNSFCEASIYKGQIQTKISPENYKTVSCAYGHKNSQQNTKK